MTWQDALGLLKQFPQIAAPVPVLLTWLARSMPAVPFEGKSLATILASLLVVSVVAEFLIAWLTGQLQSWDSAKAVKLIGEAWSLFSVAFASHTAAKTAYRVVKAKVVKSRKISP